jgi:hypothetical protein
VGWKRALPVFGDLMIARPAKARNGKLAQSIGFHSTLQRDTILGVGRARLFWLEYPQPKNGDNTMNADSAPLVGKKWTATELRKLPAEQRDAILEAAAALAEEIYRNNPELTDFEAFGEDDLYGESTAAPEG